MNKHLETMAAEARLAMFDLAGRYRPRLWAKDPSGAVGCVLRSQYGPAAVVREAGGRDFVAAFCGGDGDAVVAVSTEYRGGYPELVAAELVRRFPSEQARVNRDTFPGLEVPRPRGLAHGADVSVLDDIEDRCGCDTDAGAVVVEAGAAIVFKRSGEFWAYVVDGDRLSLHCLGHGLRLSRLSCCEIEECRAHAALIRMAVEAAL